MHRAPGLRPRGHLACLLGPERSVPPTARPVEKNPLDLGQGLGGIPVTAGSACCAAQGVEDPPRSPEPLPPPWSSEGSTGWRDDRIAPPGPIHGPAPATSVKQSGAWLNVRAARITWHTASAPLGFPNQQHRPGGEVPASTLPGPTGASRSSSTGRTRAPRRRARRATGRASCSPVCCAHAQGLRAGRAGLHCWPRL